MPACRALQPAAAARAQNDPPSCLVVREVVFVRGVLADAVAVEGVGVAEGVAAAQKQETSRFVRVDTRTPRPFSTRTGKPAELPKLVPSPVLPVSDVAQRRKDGVCRRRAPLITARGEIARTAVAPTSACITDAGASARTAGALASASITAREESAGTAGARRDRGKARQLGG